MRVLVIGATGYVGRSLVASAARAGHEVIAHVRPESPTGDRAAAQLVAAGARVVRTPWTGEAWYRYLEANPPDRIVLALGTTSSRARAASRTGGADASQSAVDLGLTMMLVNAARTAAPETGLVYLSALGASATGNEYLRVRATVEAALSGGPNPFTVVRPSFITGPDRGESRPVERIGAFLGNSLTALLRMGGNRRRAAKLASISGPDLASILVGLASEPLDGRVHELDDFRS
jgi:uncharacterized protein YbjT (DUF2867 family)